jgi:hypothetical protein
MELHHQQEKHDIHAAVYAKMRRKSIFFENVGKKPIQIARLLL